MQKLANESLAHIVTVEVESAREGTLGETGKHNVAPKSRAPKMVAKGRTYSLKLTNARGDVWEHVSYSIGSGLTHDAEGRELHPKAEDVLYSLMLDASMAEDYTTFEDFAENMGLDSDSRKALEMYLECGKIYNKLVRLFNGAELASINKVTEDM